MSSIDKLTSKIIGDSELKAKALIEEARAEEKKLIESKVSEAQEQRTALLKKAEDEAKTRGERVISNAELQVRNLRLSAKQQVLDKVFTDALVSLSNISNEKTLEFIKNNILSLGLTSDVEIILGEGSLVVSEEFINELNASLQASGKTARVKLNPNRRNIKGGFILSKNGVEINYSFEALVKNARNELEAEVASTLFN